MISCRDEFISLLQNTCCWQVRKEYRNDKYCYNIIRLAYAAELIIIQVIYMAHIIQP